MFIHYNNKIVNSNEIKLIMVDEFISNGYIKIYFKPHGLMELVKGPEALNIIQTLCPAALEGKQAKYVKHAWAIHNLIGHPLMQIFSWLHLPALGIKIHDATVPDPLLEER